MDHPGALGHAADGDLAAVDLETHGEFLPARVGGHDGLRGLGAVFGAEFDHGLFNPPANLNHGEPIADASGGADQPFAGTRFRFPRDVLHHDLGVGYAAHAGAGIGAAGIDHDAANLSPADMFHGELDRGGLD